MSENTIVQNKAVYFTYRVTDEEGNLMEQSDLPIGYVHGANSGLLPKLEEALAGHKEGDELEIDVSPEEGFGQPDPDLIYRDKLDNVPPEYRFVGATPQFQNDQGDVKTFTVTSIENNEITMDGNHPYAGKTIRFVVKVHEVRDADNDEIASGRPKDAPPIIH